MGNYTTQEQRIYNKAYYAGYKKATIMHLGNKCVQCGTAEQLTIHHNSPLYRQARTVRDLDDLSKLEVRCKDHHDCCGVYRK